MRELKCIRCKLLSWSNIKFGQLIYKEMCSSKRGELTIRSWELKGWRLIFKQSCLMWSNYSLLFRKMGIEKPHIKHPEMRFEKRMILKHYTTLPSYLAFMWKMQQFQDCRLKSFKRGILTEFSWFFSTKRGLYWFVLLTSEPNWRINYHY